MYYTYFGFKRNPFEIIPDPTFLFLSKQHREALSYLKYAVLEKKPFLLLIGDIGVGKTLLLNFFIRNFNEKKNVVLIPILNPNLTLNDFYLLVAKKVGLYNIKSKAEFLEEFQSYISNLSKQGKSVVLLIDDVQAMPLSLLKELQLLSNVVSDSQCFVVILVGQPALYVRLMNPKMLPLRQRFSFKFYLEAFNTVEDVEQYLKTRILKAGSSRTDLFTSEAIEAIFSLSGGVPRLINIICDHALLEAYLQRKSIIDKKVILEAIKDIDHLVFAKSFSFGFGKAKKVLAIILFLFIILLIIGLFYFVGLVGLDLKEILGVIKESLG